MFAKILSTETVRHFIRWIIFVFVIQTFTLLVFNLGDNSEGVLIVISKVAAFFGFSLFLFVPYFLTRRELIASREQRIYSGWLMGFLFSFIFSIILLLFAFLDMGFKAYLGEVDFNSSLVFWGSVVGAIMGVVLGTFSGGMAQVIMNKKKNNKEL